MSDMLEVAGVIRRFTRPIWVRWSDHIELVHLIHLLDLSEWVGLVKVVGRSRGGE